MPMRALIFGLLSVIWVCCAMPQPALAEDSKPVPTAVAPTAESDSPDAEAPSSKPQKSQATSRLNEAIGEFNGWVVSVLFFSVTGDVFDIPEVDRDGNGVVGEDGKPKIKKVGFPFIVFVLVAGGIFFSLFYRFISFRAFRHAIDVVRGKFDNPDDEGEISHFRALTSALSATVGLGNIAGVAIAIQQGGPGAVFWMIIAALFGMCLKFNSCTLSQMYRKTNADGSVSGGPMYYLDIGLREIGGAGSPLAMLGKALAFMFALMIMGGSFGGGNMFQANQSYAVFQNTFGLSSDAIVTLGGWHVTSADFFGIVMAVLVGLVILGGIQRIGAATSRIVPAMVALYCLASLFIIFANVTKIPECIGLIVKLAFTENALYGGAVGVMVKGFQRAAFSNEAGIGSAAVAHAAAKTDEPVREGMVAMLGPVIDTVIVCLMTALVVVITGAWDDPNVAQAKVEGVDAGVIVTSAAFASEISWFPIVLTVSVVLFAYSTMISWAYYGERGWIYVVDHVSEGAGHKTLVVYRLVFLLFVYAGTVTSLKEVLLFSDLMILCMAFPNIVGGAILAPRVLRALNDYWDRFQQGKFKLHPKQS